MNLEAKISLFFGKTSAIICAIRTEGAAVPYAPKLTDQEEKVVNYKITAE